MLLGKRTTSCAAVAILLVSGAARAEVGELRRRSDDTAEAPRPIPPADELSAPRLPAPFLLPELSHPHFDAGVSWTLGTATMNGGTANASGTPASAAAATAAGDSTIGLVRASVEARIGRLRRLYIGASLPAAVAAIPGTGSGAKSVLGNAETHLRVVFPMPSWLAFGAALGVTAPTAAFDRNGPAAAAAAAASSLEPASNVQLAAGAVAFRPAFDARILRGPLVVQVRQGLDVVIDSAGRESARTQATILAHVGVLLSRATEISVEGAQLYFFASDVPDDRRSAIALGPGFRLSLGRMDVGAGVFTNLSPGLGDVDRFYAMRVSLIGHI